MVGEEKSGVNGIKQGSLLVTEQFLTMIDVYSNLHTHTRVHVMLVKSE